ncbi:MAG: hypothetical protein HN904_06345 [Victivallales bacterium]|nr:hypothetical protein [Victivallales bacterium]
MKLILALLVITTAQVALSTPQQILARRAALQKAAGTGTKAVPVLVKGLTDENMVVRRTAARLLARMVPMPNAALGKALVNEDALVRRFALDRLTTPLGPKAVPYLGTALGDPAPELRLAAVERLAAIKPRTKKVIELLTRARVDANTGVARAAGQSLWDFHRDVTLLRNRPDWDYEVRVVKTLPLPKEGWRFRTDPRAGGHVEKWFATGFDDAKWQQIAIEQAWQKAGVDYVGVSWYRRIMDLPAKPELNAVEIRFLGVDESAWVWINGVYVGAHDIGPMGYNKSFALDITKEVKWGAANQITIRAMSTKGNGGIWRPARIEVLK